MRIGIRREHTGLLVIVALLWLLPHCQSTGKVAMQLLDYTNPGSQAYDGGCCDSIKVCINSCDNVFTICLTTKASTNKCSLFKGVTNVISSDKFTFSKSPGKNLKNPVVYTFKKWQPFKLSVKVVDNDGSNWIGSKDDFVDEYLLTIPYAPSPHTAATPDYRHTLKGQRSVMNIKVKVFCDDFYLIPDCETYCKSRDDGMSHLICDYTNGRKLCQKDWYGQDCVTYCKPRNDSGGHYSCGVLGQRICLEGWTGSNCTQENTTIASSLSLKPSPIETPRSSSSCNYMTLTSNAMVTRDTWFSSTTMLPGIGASTFISYNNNTKGVRSLNNGPLGSTTFDKGSIRTTASSENGPIRTTMSNNVPIRPTTSDNVPIRTTGSDNVPIRTTASDNVPIRPTTSENGPIRTTTSDNVPIRTTNSDNVPIRPTTSSENGPIRTTSSSENGPIGTTTSDNVPSRTTTFSENEPIRSTTSDNSLVSATFDNSKTLLTISDNSASNTFTQTHNVAVTSLSANAPTANILHASTFTNKGSQGLVMSPNYTPHTPLTPSVARTQSLTASSSIFVDCLPPSQYSAVVLIRIGSCVLEERESALREKQIIILDRLNDVCLDGKAKCNIPSCWHLTDSSRLKMITSVKTQDKNATTFELKVKISGHNEVFVLPEVLLEAILSTADTTQQLTPCRVIRAWIGTPINTPKVRTQSSPPEISSSTTTFIGIAAGLVVAIVIVIVFLWRWVRMKTISILKVHPLQSIECPDETEKPLEESYLLNEIKASKDSSKVKEELELTDKSVT